MYNPILKREEHTEVSVCSQYQMRVEHNCLPKLYYTHWVGKIFICSCVPTPFEAYSGQEAKTFQIKWLWLSYSKWILEDYEPW